jgi:lambda family phage tail tape measure protein
MATERLDIRVSETGARVVKKNIADIGGAAGEAAGGLATLKRALAGIGIALGLRELAQYADAYTQIINRLKLATDSTQDLRQAEADLFAVSQETRTSFSANAQLYGRLSIAAKELGADQATLMEFTRGVGLALSVTGTSAEQASGAILQLSQAVGSGIVRAEEFNSILEGAPRIAQAVADGLDRAGGSVAKLRKEVIEGKLSSQEFFQALLGQIPKLEKEFAETAPTIGQAFVTLQNQITRSVGQIDQALGLSSGAGAAIMEFADAIDEITPTLIVLGQEFVTFGTEFSNLLGGMSEDTKEFGSDLDGDIRSWINLWDNYAAGVRTAVKIIQDVLKEGIDFENFFGGEGGGRKPGDEPVDIESTFNQFKSGGVGAAIDRAGVNQTTRFRGFDEGPGFEQISTKPAGVDNSKETAARLKREADELLRVRGSVSSVTQAKQQLAETENILSREQIKGNVTMQEMLDILDMQRRQLADQLDPLAAINRELEIQEQNIGKTADQILVDNEVRSIQNELLKAGVELNAEEVQSLETRISLIQANAQLQEAANEQKQADLELTQQINGAAEEYYDTLEQLNRLLQENTISAQEFNDANRDALIKFLDTQRDAASGIARGLLKMEREFTDFATIAEGALRDAFKGGEDAIVQFAKTGKLEFSDFIDSLLEDLLRLSLRTAVGGLLQMAISSIGSSFGGGYANPTSAQLGTVGEPGSLPGYGFHTGRGPGEFGALRQLTAAMIDAAPRFHKGRLAPGEMAAVINDEESVLTPGQMKSMGSNKTIVQIFENSSNTSVREEEDEDEFGNKRVKIFIDDAVADRMRMRGSKIDSVMRNRFGAKQRLNTR